MGYRASVCLRYLQLFTISNTADQASTQAKQRDSYFVEQTNMSGHDYKPASYQLRHTQKTNVSQVID